MPWIEIIGLIGFVISIIMALRAKGNLEEIKWLLCASLVLIASAVDKL